MVMSDLGMAKLLNYWGFGNKKEILNSVSILILFVSIWTITGTEGRVVRIDTPNDYHYKYLEDHGINIKGYTNITFLLQATNDGHVALSRYKANWNSHSYEIVIGGWVNQKSAVRRCDQCLPKVSVDHSPLNGSLLLPFWISWANGHIRLGTGNIVYKDQLIEWQDSDPEDIRHVGLSTGWGSNGTWIFGAVDGQWSQWTSWSECSISCDGGTQTRRRFCNSPAPEYGKECEGEWFEEGLCQETPCAINGSWSSWSTFTSCSLTCGEGTRSRTRSCDNPPPIAGGQDCPGPSTEEISCKDKECAVDGGWSEWTAWSNCSRTCSEGFIMRMRMCNQPPPQHDGLNCSGPDVERRTCLLQPCPVAGSWSEWLEWEPCTLTCGGGNRSRIRYCDGPAPQYGGDHCEGEYLETQECNVFACPLDGGWTSWGGWTPCSAKCGLGQYTRTRRCSAPRPTNGGNRCRGSSFEQDGCTDVECPIDGYWSSWQPWSRCSHTCGPGHAYRARYCDEPEPQYGGLNCTGDWMELEECSTEPCPVNGGWSDWSPWSQCSVTCGTGHMTQARWCIIPRPEHGGQPCEGLSANQSSCMDAYCPIDGGWSSWGPWDTCTASCEGGTRARYRLCTEPPPQYGGLDCFGVSLINETCNIQRCPIPIGWTPWATWSECSASCGGGYRARTRDCEDPTRDNCVGTNFENWTCSFTECPVNWEYIPEIEPTEAPGAVGIGIISIIAVSLIPALTFIIDLTTLPTHIRYAKRNIRDFKVTVAEYKAKKEAKKHGRQLEANNLPPPPPPAPAPNTSRASKKSSNKAGTGGSKSKPKNGNTKNKTPLQRNGVSSNTSFDNLGMISEEPPTRPKHKNDLSDRNRRNNFNISPAYNSGYGNHFIVDANINHFDSPYHHSNHHHSPRSYGSPYDAYDAYDDYGTPGRDAQTMTQY